MTLQNLLSIGRLKPHKATAAEMRRLLASAETAIADAKRPQNSAATRFDMAYKAIMQCALAALMANGYRPSTGESGHQQTTIQTLPKTIGLSAEKMTILDGFRRARNLSDYEGEPVEDAKVRECIEWAEALYADVRLWIEENQPDLN
jgi:uncharacterized protein (UPF0332 family)